MKTTQTNKNKATHTGHCQLCGHEQKLPGGVLAKHGYNVQWGFFSGTCPGSGSLPYEVSIDLIDRAIESTQAAEARVEAQIAAVLANTTPVVMRRDYNQKGKPWVSVTLKLDGTRQGLHFQYSVMTDADLIARFNTVYAKYLSEQANNLAEYAQWLTERKATWKPAELKPVAA